MAVVPRPGGPTALVVGLGRAASFSLPALAAAGVRVVGGVDPKLEHDVVPLPAGVARFSAIGQVPESMRVDLALVATPTPTHVEVCRELLRLPQAPRLILCEKPLSTSPDEVEALLREARERGVRLQVLYHYAFTPEVRWVRERHDVLAERYGELVSFQQLFADDYRDELAERAAALGSSWADAAVNALSVVAGLVELVEVTATRVDGIAFGAAEVDFRRRSGASGKGEVETSWLAERPVKRTRLRFGSDAVLELDHREGSAILVGSDGRRPCDAPAGESESSLSARYRTMIAAHVADDPGVFGDETTVLLHRLLAQGLATTTGEG